MGSSPGSATLAARQRILRITFESKQVFTHEYATNISRGGIFIPTPELIEIHAPVSVHIEFAYCGSSLSLDGEVVHCVPPDLAAVGGVPGVAVQFASSAKQVTEKLAGFLDVAGVAGPGNERRVGAGRRSASRSEARVSAQLRMSDGSEISGTTRNLSTAGVLVASRCEQLGVGHELEVTLRCRGDAGRGEAELEMTIPGVVARLISGDGGRVAAAGIQFLPRFEDAEAVRAFLESVKSSEHIRQLGKITGPISALGVANLIQTFSSSAPASTLVLTRGGEQGLICVRDHVLHAARLGPATGLKAIVRMMCFEEGSFQFEACIDDGIPAQPPMPLDIMLAQATLLADEMRQPGRLQLNPLVTLLVDAAAVNAAADDLEKLDRAILDLAAVRMSVHRIVDTIPEPDPHIYDHLSDLIERGLLEPAPD